MIYCLARRIEAKSTGGVKETLVAAQRLPNTGLEGRLRHKMWHCLFQSTGSRGTELIVGAGPCVCSGDSENGGTCRFLKSQILFMLHPDLHVWQHAFFPEQKGPSRRTCNVNVHVLVHMLSSLEVGRDALHAFPNANPTI